VSAEVFGIIAPHPPIIVPAVGRGEERVTQATVDALATARAALDRFAPETIVLMSPHAPAAADALLVDGSAHFNGVMSQFGDSTVYEWDGDPGLAAELIVALRAADLPVVERLSDPRLRSGWLDHGTIVPLSYLDPARTRRLVVLSLSYLPLAVNRQLGALVREIADKLGRRVAFIASGDCSHRLTHDAPAGYAPEGAQFDDWLLATIGAGEFEQLASVDPDFEEAAGECGLRSFIALGGFAGDDPVPTRVLSYEGPWGVGYLTALVGPAAIEAMPDSDDPFPGAQSGAKGGSAGEVESEIVALARRTIEARVRDPRPAPVPPPLAGGEYPQRAGAFVSLHRGGDLRGCIGTIAPTAPTLAEEVAHNAVEAALHDPRFPPLAEDELADLEVKVDVLQEPESCTLEDLDPARYGVIVSDGWRRGLLLPDLEGVDDVAMQVSIAMRKAGISPGEQCAVERFKVDRYT
jgi:MEMO1 family protein